MQSDSSNLVRSDAVESEVLIVYWAAGLANNSGNVTKQILIKKCSSKLRFLGN